MGSGSRLRAVCILGLALAACSSTFTSSLLPVPPEGGVDAGSDALVPRDSPTSADAPSEASSASDASDATDGPPATDASNDGDAMDAGGPSLCNGSFLYCDGFEQGLANWSMTQAVGGALTADALHVYRGTKALHAHVDAVADAGTTTYAYAQKFQTWPKHFFTRFFAYVPSPPLPSQAGLLNLLQQASPYAGIELLLEATTPDLGMVTYVTSNNQSWQSSTAEALDQWVCVEVEVDVGAETAHVYMNDAEVTDLMRTNLALPQLGIVDVGLAFFQARAQGPVDAWIDEVAVNGSRVGCAQ